jgi:hypothetical protein
MTVATPHVGFPELAASERYRGDPRTGDA